jgi:glyoxylase-like metal-dependent hydrolase (beta-lactamase superfamily II)
MLVEWTGDLLFVGKVGGASTDNDAEVEWKSLHRLLENVPDDTTVWPGHDRGVRPRSTIGMERQTKPFLCCADFEGFLQLRTSWPTFKKENDLK